LLQGLHVHGAAAMQAEQKQQDEDFYGHELHRRQSIFGIVD
jgi:hypothetical protein